MTDRVENYTVGWVSAIPTEYAIACELLDEEYKAGQTPRITARNDSNLYTFGRIHEHNVVIACLPKGQYGTTSAALVAERMQTSFPALRFGLLVGIAGGAPSDKHDIRLGDVVVSCPTPRHGGVIQYDFGKALGEHKFEETGYLAPPPQALLTALASLIAKHMRHGHKLETMVTDTLRRNQRLQARYGRPDRKTDKLYKTSWVGDQLVERKARDPEDDDPAVFHGLIASANRLMKDRKARDALIRTHDVLCFEMEAAGIVNSFPCLVIRGICDYSDSHKDDSWQGYAAATAAAYAKELLEIIPGKDVTSMQTIENANADFHQTRFDAAFSLVGMPVPKNFVDRPMELQRLQQTLISEDRCRRRLAVLRGLGGIGKTQLAVEFARRNKTNFSAIGWLDAGSEDKLKQSMVSFAGRISSDSSKNQDLLAGADNTDAVVRNLLNWLSDPDNIRWLLVFDNVDRDLDDSTDTPAYDVRRYFPSADHGSILITTRLGQLEQLGQSQEIRKVDDSTAQNILASWYSKTNGTIYAQRLLELLDGLPLAIAQAGAFLQQSGMHIRDYIRKYEEKHDEINKIIQQPDFKLEDYPDRNIWTTWTISFEAILKRNKDVAHLLLLWSFFDRNDFWHGLFIKMIEDPIGREAIRQQIGDVVEQESSFLEAMQLLRNYSLVEGSEGTDGFTMHAVVHRWAYLCQASRSRLELGLLAFVTIGLSVPYDDERNFDRQGGRLLPHAQACYQQTHSTSSGEANTIEDYLRQSKSDMLICMLIGLNRMAILFGENGKLAEAEQMCERAVIGFTEAVGERHPCTLAAADCLGDLYRLQGKLTQAEQVLGRALAAEIAVLGNKHTITLSTVLNLGTLYTRQGKLVQAEQMYELALTGYEEVLGENHTYALNTINNLGNLYRLQGRLSRAEQTLQRALAGKKATLGGKHTATIGTMMSLGILYDHQDRPGEAEQMYRQALEGYEEKLGSKHVSTLAARRSLGFFYFNQGRFVEAKQVLLPALQGLPTTTFNFGKLEADVPALIIITCLGYRYRETRPNAARKLFSRALNGFRMYDDKYSKYCAYIEWQLEELELLLQSTEKVEAIADRNTSSCWQGRKAAFPN